uniref:Uncharacterized protein n=1 Tax=Molossus molossus TaxID=27622 RepID=A0A7J8C906_MOLMO|nr:hypothetical protein HJG59_009972 [Molossus molossus]
MHIQIQIKLSSISATLMPSQGSSTPSTTSSPIPLPTFRLFLYSFSMAASPSMIARVTIKIKPSLKLIYPFSSLPSSSSFYSPGFFSKSLHSGPQLPQSHLPLNSHCNLAFLPPLHGTALAKVTNNFPDPEHTCHSSSYLTTAESDSTNHFLASLKCFPSLAFMILFYLGFFFHLSDRSLSVFFTGSSLYKILISWSWGWGCVGGCILCLLSPSHSAWLH